PGPGMLGQILRGLPGAAPGAGLRQHQREIRRLEQRPRRLAVRALAAEQLESRLRAHHPVIVLELVGERQLAAPASLITNRRSSVPLEAAPDAATGASARPPLATTSRRMPLARMMSVLPAGTERTAADCTGSPGRSPCRISGGLPV